MTNTTTTERRNAPAVGVWDVDMAHSDLVITARHLMVAKVRGTFTEIKGTIEVAEEPSESRVEFEAKAESVSTGVEDRDNHLRSPDFLDVENHPLVTFVSTGLASAGDDWTLTGDLSIRGVTKSVTFELTYEGSVTDPYGNTKAAFGAKGEIDRETWGLTWNAPIEGGGVMVSKNLKVEFDVEATLRN